MVSLKRFLVTGLSITMLISCGAEKKAGRTPGEAAADESNLEELSQEDAELEMEGEIDEDSAEYRSKKPKVTYERITIPLPTPPGVDPLPPAIFFDVDNRFTAQEKTRIRNLIVTNIGFWQQHYAQKAANPPSQLAACSLKFATKELQPVWYPRKAPKITDGEAGADFAMDALTNLFADNGNEKAPVAKIKYVQSKKQTTIVGDNGSKERKTPLDVTINQVKIADPNIPNLFLTGSLLHGWLHRAGYRHPKNKYTTFLIAESPMCIMRGFQDKNPNVPDSTFTQFFD